MATKARTYANGRRMWGAVGRRMFDPEGREYELVNWGADGGGVRAPARGSDDPEPFVGEFWRSLAAGRSLVVLASD